MVDFHIFFQLSVNYKLEDTHRVKNSFHLDVRKNFFSNRVVDAWNELPQFSANAETVNSFKARLHKFYVSRKRKC